MRVVEVEKQQNNKLSLIGDAIYAWQMPCWPVATVNRSLLKDELAAFGVALKNAKAFLGRQQDAEAVARAIVQEAVKTSSIEGVNVDESVVMSSVCRVLGVAYAPEGFTKDVRAEGVAKMMLAIRNDWSKPLSASLLKRWHKALLTGVSNVTIGDFRNHKEPMRVIRRLADGTAEVRYEAPPSDRVGAEIVRFLKMWKAPVSKPADVALKAAMLHPHFESIHPFEDGNGRVGRALVAKTLAEGLELPLVLPVSAVIARHRAAYYDEINEASRSLDWTSWAAFFIPVLTETIEGFVQAVKFIAAKRAYLGKYENGFSPRAKKVIARMFEDGEPGVKVGLSVAKWMRMAKVSKPTATRDLGELVEAGAIVRYGDGPQTRYILNHSAFTPNDEPIEGINEGIKDMVLRLVRLHPGRGVPFFRASVKASRATVERVVATLIASGKVEHRGSKKTGGYYAVNR